MVEQEKEAVLLKQITEKLREWKNYVYTAFFLIFILKIKVCE